MSGLYQMCVPTSAQIRLSIWKAIISPSRSPHTTLSHLFLLLTFFCHFSTLFFHTHPLFSHFIYLHYPQRKSEHSYPQTHTLPISSQFEPSSPRPTTHARRTTNQFQQAETICTFVGGVSFQFHSWWDKISFILFGLDLKYRSEHNTSGAGVDGEVMGSQWFKGCDGRGSNNLNLAT